MIISPSILSADFANLERDVKKVVSCGARWIHIDVMDGHFVPNITIGAPVVKALRKVTDAKLDVHLMIENPLKYIPDFIEAGSDIIVFHIEATGEDSMIPIKMIKDAGKICGISLKPKTPLETILPFIDFIDMVLVMTVEPGFSGQEFMEDAALKIKEIKTAAEKAGKKDFIIQVDGGINDKTASLVKSYGANCLVSGNYIFKSLDMKQAMESLL